MHLPFHRILRLPASSRHGIHRNRGLSALEMIGCLVAIGTGIWLGARYLEFDLREAWNFGAEKTGLTSFEMTIPESHDDAEDTDLNVDSELSRSHTNSGETGKLSSQGGDPHSRGSDLLNQPARAGSAKPKPGATGIDEGGPNGVNSYGGGYDGVGGVPSDTGTDELGSGEVSTTIAKKHKSNHQKEAMGQESLSYWNKLNDIMAQEEQMRAVPPGGLTAANAMLFLTNREKAARYAAKAIQRLTTQDVDPAVCQQAQAIAEWYLQGAALSERALQLLTSGSPSLRKGPMGKKWKADERQHLDELNLINHRSDVLRSQLSQRYGIPFPDLR